MSAPQTRARTARAVPRRAGDQHRLLRITDRIAIPVGGRSLVVGSVIALLSLFLSLATLAWGDLGVGPGDLLDAARGAADTKVTFVLERLRGPRVLVAIGVGLALGLSGALFQSVTRNPLGSPDVIGLGAGAGAGATMTTLLWNGAIPTPLGAVAGAGVAIAVVHWSTGLGFASPARVIVTGIGVAAMATALTQYVVAVALRDSAEGLAAYLVGSLGTRTMQQAAIIWISLSVLVPAVGVLTHRLRLMDLGDELAEALGGRATHTRTWAIVLAVLLSAAAVAVAGPIAFVALTAPHIARRVTRAPGPNLAVAALTGALIMVAADFLAQHLPVLEGMPVGIITAGVGGVYLGYLLVQEWRKASV
ncbi:FecCD family ABC transporter permease [Nocardioides insulae]|uniref:FecCD family ABC transporter permease n=1 Tax=Nocardioides insulae TaxID=394734 RepID=UPI0004297EAE|nr:iron chelate uptake ABC transporter family permease subunit [Nocardioides insulae]